MKCPECGREMTPVLPLWCPVPGVWLCYECDPPVVGGWGSGVAMWVPCFGQAFGFIRYRPGVVGLLRAFWVWCRWLAFGNPSAEGED